MPRQRTVVPSAPQTSVVLEWDRNNKEPWLIDFEKETINDNQWTCIATVAVQSEAQDEYYLQVYTQSIKAGSKRPVKIITMGDVVALLKEYNAAKGKQEEASSKTEKLERSKTSSGDFPSSYSQIVPLVAQYAVLTDVECKLPSDLMAVLLKYIILRMKAESCFQKKVQAVRSRKLREDMVKANFIKSLKEFQTTELKSYPNSQSSTDSFEAINDEPLAGPDLYIILVDFYDVFLMPELLRVNIPLVALIKVSSLDDEPFPLTTPEESSRKSIKLAAFWETLLGECIVLEKTGSFKDIAMMHYFAPSPALELFNIKLVDELTWMQYSAYCIYRQHQKFLKEMYVQRIAMSLEPLDLSTCTIYNKLCDALITGEPITNLMVLYSMVEQVVVGVPETKHVFLNYHPKPGNFFTRPKSARYTVCQRDRGRHSLKTPRASAIASQRKSLRNLDRKSTNSITGQEYESLLDLVLSEKKAEEEYKGEKKWKTPCLCTYGDFVFKQSFYCDPRLFDGEDVVRRFMENSDFFRIWKRYPKLPPEERVYYNYHFFSLWKASGQSEELLKQKIFCILSRRLTDVTRSFLYRGEPDNVSDTRSGERESKPVKLPKVIFKRKSSTGRLDSFSTYFFRTFIDEISHKAKRKAVFSLDKRIASTESQKLMKITGYLNMFKTSNPNSWIFKSLSSGACERISASTISEINQESQLKIIAFLTECLELSTLTDADLLAGNEEYLSTLKSFKFYEKLEPTLMIQRLVKARENYNTVQFMHFVSTDTLIITMHDDYDYRGLFHKSHYGSLPTPVALRDFYNYIYPEISKWLIRENEEHTEYISNLANEIKAQEEREDKEYLSYLKQQYSIMCEEERAKFLEKVIDFTSVPEVLESELEDLPDKPRPPCPKSVSFITTNLTEMRVENSQKIQEFHSRDGTKITVSIDNWLYTPLSLLTLGITRANFLLYYNQWLGQDPATAFTFKTISNIIFAFSKNKETESDFMYNVTISWPTGLVIHPARTGSSIYVKQSYLKPLTNGWKGDEEESRCFVRNGEIIIFKTNGDYDVLASNGTKYSFYDSPSSPRYEITSTTGEVWEVRTKGPCRNRKKLLSRNKIFIGVDPKTHESYYKREDGTQCMLWNGGKLVTNYPDGTKITSTPSFDEEEITVEWDEEEKLHLGEIIQKVKSDYSTQDPRSRNSSSSKSSEKPTITFEGFVSVSCKYLMEHPKYSTVFVNAKCPYVTVTLPENLNIRIYPEGLYEVQQESHFLRVRDTVAEFQTVCFDCDNNSTVKLNLDSNPTLCTFKDFFRKGVVLQRNGEIKFKEFNLESVSEERAETRKFHDSIRCSKGHIKGEATTQRWFALERDLSGVEFLHEDSLEVYASNLPEMTYRDQNETSHTFSSYYSKAGYENWVMNYEDKLDSFPVNIKKKDLKELGAKQVPKNLFQYPFPKHHNCGNQQQKEKVKNNVNAPVLIVTRTLLSFPTPPDCVMSEMKKFIMAYQKHAVKIVRVWKKKKCETENLQNSRYLEMRLQRIGLTLNRSSEMYPHLGIQLASNERSFHYLGHFINLMQELKGHFWNPLNLLPKCKQIPSPMHGPLELPTIYEETEGPDWEKNKFALKF